MQKFDWGKFKTENIAVHCKTEEEAKDFCKKMHEQGMKWNGDDSSFLETTRYYVFQKETCYSGTGRYCYYDYYKGNEYTILEWSDYMRKEFTKSDLKDGMVVEYRNGKRRLVLNNRLIGKDGYYELNKYKEDMKVEESSERDIMRVFKIVITTTLSRIFHIENLELIWERKEVKRMTAEEMRQKLEEITGEKIEIEPSRGEMMARLYQYCDECSNCYTKCSIKRECRTKGNFFNYDTEDLKQCYEKVEEDGRKK